MIRIAEVQEFCETGTGGTPSRGKITLYYGGNIPWVKSGELHQAVILDTREKITEIAIQEARLKIVTKNAILIAMYGATVGQVSRLGIDATTNQAVCHLLPDVEVCFPSYLYYCLLSKRREFLFRRVGGGQSNISQGIIRTTKIPLPFLNKNASPPSSKKRMELGKRASTK
ncbi:MAG: hypothetical protein COC22_03325 [Flavobacteriaceae bacterium]|nr:MAG: hypothetical protein COC22_03325 [Flavobacteriaceae bacterium]